MNGRLIEIYVEVAWCPADRCYMACAWDAQDNPICAEAGPTVPLALTALIAEMGRNTWESKR